MAKPQPTVCHNNAATRTPINADLTSGTDALSFLFAATDPATSATYKGNPLNGQYPPRIYITIDAAAPPAGVQGDYNNNGVVDAADYVVWANGGPLQNEVTGVSPGVVAPDDYDAWRARLGNVSGSGSGSAVPEPTSILLVFAGLIGLAVNSRRSR